MAILTIVFSTKKLREQRYTVYYQNFARVTEFGPVVAGKADSVSSVSASACHIGRPNSVNPGQILLVYGKFFWPFLFLSFVPPSDF